MEDIKNESLFIVSSLLKGKNFIPTRGVLHEGIFLCNKFNCLVCHINRDLGDDMEVKHTGDILHETIFLN